MQKLLLELIEQSPTAVAVVNSAGKIVYVNTKLEALFGYRRQDLVQAPIEILVPERFTEDHPVLRNNFHANPISRPMGTGRNLLARRKDGIEFPAEISLTPIMDAGAPLVLNWIIDISDRQAAEQVLRESHAELLRQFRDRTADLRSINAELQQEISRRRRTERDLAAKHEMLDTTLRSISNGVLVANLADEVILINRAAEALTGWSHEDAIGQHISVVFPVIGQYQDEQAQKPLIINSRQDKITSEEKEYRLMTKIGRERPVSISTAPLKDADNRIVGMVAVFRDITWRRQLEEEILRSEKLSSLSILAGGLAHDFNNFLQIVALSIGAIKLQRIGTDDARGLLDAMEESIDQAKGITRQLLDLTSGGIPTKYKMNLGPLLKRGVKFALQGSRVIARYKIADGLWPVDIDPQQINQVIYNLVINACQAMQGGGKLTVCARNIVIDDDSGHQHLKPGHYVEVSFRDQGPGIPQEIIGSIFDPYFTTRKAGSGLGLFSCYSILKKHDGRITVISKLNRGSNFTTYLPGYPKIDKPVSSGTKKMLTGTAKILVLDAKEALRFGMSILLRELGYQVHTVAEGAAAIEAYRESRKAVRPFDVLLLDANIPGGLAAGEIIGPLRQINGEIKAIVTSGDSMDPLLENFQKMGFKAALVKPFTPEELSSVIKKVLED